MIQNKSKIKSANPSKTEKPDMKKIKNPKPFKTIVENELVKRKETTTKMTPLKNSTQLGKNKTKNPIHIKTGEKIKK